MSPAHAPAQDLAPRDFLWAPLRSRWRWAVAATAAITAAVHLPVIVPHLHEAPYMGEEFVVLTAACLALGLAALLCDSAAVYGFTVLTCGAAVIGYVTTRVIAFPQLADDVGNWLEPLGVVSMVAETVAVFAAICALSGASRAGRRPRLAPSTRPCASAAAFHPPTE